MDIARFPVAVGELTTGLFVVELDRPWSESPFLIEGFLVEDEETLARLRALCKLVYVDARRSDFNALPDAARKLLAAAPVEEKVVLRYVQAPSAVPVATEKLPAEPEWLKGLKPGGRTKTEAPPPEKPRLVVSAQEASLKDRASITMDTQLLTPEEWTQLRRELGTLLTHPAEEALKRVAAARDAMAGSVGSALSKPMEGLKSLFRRKAAPVLTRGERSGADTGPVKILVYDDLTRTEDELERARAAYALATRAWEGAAQAVTEDSPPDMALLEQAARAMSHSAAANPDGLAWVSRTTADERRRAQHAVRVATALLTHGRHLGWSIEELERLALAGLLMDIGLVLIPAAIRDKQSRLTLDEYDIIKTHVELVAETIGRSTPLHTAVLDAVLQHHERLDGTGYPHGLAGPAISTVGRMAAISDAYSALTAPRTYARAVAPFDAVLVLLKRNKQWFDPDLLETFIQALGPYPVGSLVEMSSGEIGLVARSNRQHRLQPVVLLIATPDRKRLAHPTKVDLATRSAEVKGRDLKIARGLPIDAEGIDVREYHSALT